MQSAYYARIFPRMTSMAKNVLNVWGAVVGRLKTVGLRNPILCAPCAEKVENCKLHHEKPNVSY